MKLLSAIQHENIVNANYRSFVELLSENKRFAHVSIVRRGENFEHGLKPGLLPICVSENVSNAGISLHACYSKKGVSLLYLAVLIFAIFIFSFYYFLKNNSEKISIDAINKFLRIHGHDFPNVASIHELASKVSSLTFELNRASQSQKDYFVLSASRNYIYQVIHNLDVYSLKIKSLVKKISGDNNDLIKKELELSANELEKTRNGLVEIRNQNFEEIYKREMITNPYKYFGDLKDQFKEWPENFNKKVVIDIDSSGFSSKSINIKYHLLSTVIKELVKNSVEAIQDEGKVSVTFLTLESGVKVSVADSGHGISSKNLMHINNGLHLRSKIKGEFGGTGLFHISSCLKGLGFEVESSNSIYGGFMYSFVIPKGAAGSNVQHGNVL